MLNRKREKREKERKQDRFTICCKTFVTGSLFWRVSNERRKYFNIHCTKSY